MTSEEVEKIVKNLPDDMQGILIKGLYDAADTMCNIADYMRGNYVPISVIEDIKAEIELIKKAEYQIYGKGSWNFVGKCLDVIDKHTSGANGGDK